MDSVLIDLRDTVKGLRRDPLFAAAVVATLALTIGASTAVFSMFVRSFVQLLRVEPGFSPDRVVAVEIAPVTRRYPDADARAVLYDRIMTAARHLPGLASAAWASALPLTGETWVDRMARIDDPRPSS